MGVLFYITNLIQDKRYTGQQKWICCIAFIQKLFIVNPLLTQ